MLRKDNRYTSLVIIGNGFDLAHLYKTSYKHFIDAVGEEFFQEYRNYLSEFSGDDSEWNSFEKSVEAQTLALYQKVVIEGTYNDSDIINFNAVFQEIKEKLIEYLDAEIASKPFQEIKSIRRTLGRDTIAINFNYTDIAENYLHDVLYVHGSIREKDIVLGYDPMDALCLASYENRKWFKLFSREILTFKRYIKENLAIPSSDSRYLKLCEEYEHIMALKNSSKGLESEDVSQLINAEVINKYLSTICDDDIFAQRDISLSNISKIVVLGHSIKSDESYLRKILDKCASLQQIILFKHEKEMPEEWEEKKEFFMPFCVNIEKETY